MYSTPVLFLIFARPETTKKVFERIRAIKPQKLYVAADGPRKNNLDEIQRSKDAKHIIDSIDWPCEVKKLYRDDNLGCMFAVSDAISWFFDNEEYGVILEDDCLPDLSFFLFCEELLLKYRDDNRIGHIGGSCFFPTFMNNEYSYNFTTIPEIWGWASWRRVWKNYDANFSYYKKYNKTKWSDLIYLNLREKIYFSSFLPDVLSKKINTWDVQYYFMLRLQQQLCISPVVNLVSNIGLASELATHTKTSKDKMYRSNSEMNFPLSHPLCFLRNKYVDCKTIKSHFFSYKRCLRYLLSK